MSRKERSNMFAKIFGDGPNQILVKRDMDGDDHEVSLFFSLDDNTIQKMAFKWPGDTEGNLNKAKEAFDGITEEMARGIVADVSAHMRGK